MIGPPESPPGESGWGALCLPDSKAPALSLASVWGSERLRPLGVPRGAVLDKFPDVAPRAFDPVKLTFLINTVHNSDIVCLVPKFDTFPYIQGASQGKQEKKVESKSVCVSPR